MALTKEQIKEFKKAEKEAEDYDAFKNVADDIAEAGDREWAKKVYEKAENKAEECSDFCDLVDSIDENLDDKEWVKNIYKKAEDKAEDYSDFSVLGDSINEKLNDKEWATKLYKKAEDKADYSSDFSGLAYSIYENLGDKDWAKKVYEKAEEKTEDYRDFSGLAYSIHENLDDKQWAKKLYEKAVRQAEGCFDFINLADSINEKLNDKEWATKLYKKAEGKAETSDDYESLAESISDNLGDKKWAAIVKKKKKVNKSNVLRNIYFSGPELTCDEWRLKEKDINSIQKLNDIISALTEGEERTAHLVLGILGSSKDTKLDEVLVSIEHPDGNDVDFTIKNKGSLIKKPKKEEFVFVCFYYYDHSSYTLNPKKKFKNICLEIKSFQGEAILTETDYPNFDLAAEDASGGGEYRLEIYCENDQSFEGTVANKEELIKEFSDYLIDEGIIMSKDEKKSINKVAKKATKKKAVKKVTKKRSSKKGIKRSS